MQSSTEVVRSPEDLHIAQSFRLHVRAIGRDYLSLAKPRIIVLLLITEIATMVIAERGIPPIGLLIWASLGGALASGGAGAINCWYDRDIDRVMARTCSRPVPSGRILPWQALTFGVSLIVASVVVFVVAVNTLAAALALGGGLFYVFIYTMLLKRRTPLNIVIGGAAGAFPPLVAWAAVRGDIAWPALALFVVVFLWTPPHFWSLALLLRKDYKNANIPMLPGIIGTARTHRRILLYTLILVAASLLRASRWVPGTRLPPQCSEPVISAGALGTLGRIIASCGVAVPLFAGVPGADLRRRSGRGSRPGLTRFGLVRQDGAGPRGGVDRGPAARVADRERERLVGPGGRIAQQRHGDDHTRLSRSDGG